MACVRVDAKAITLSSGDHAGLRSTSWCVKSGTATLPPSDLTIRSPSPVEAWIGSDEPVVDT